MNIKNVLNILLLQVMAFICISCVWEARISFDEAIHDFGKVEQNRILCHDFTFTNNGNRKLVITKLRAG